MPPEHRAAQWAEEFDAQPGGDWASDFHTAEQRHSGVGAQSWAAQFGDAHQQQQRQRQQQRPSEQSWASEFTQHTERPPAFAAPAARGVSTAEADAMAAASQQVRCWSMLLGCPASPGGRYLVHCPWRNCEGVAADAGGGQALVPALAWGCGRQTAAAGLAADRQHCGAQDWAAEFGQDRLAEGVDRWADTFASDMAGGLLLARLVLVFILLLR